jgi:23S rRNA (uridine2552-2'-O)-methyltransferase
MRYKALTDMKTYRDHYFRKARREHYPARSVYKLKEMDARFRLFRTGMKVLDLGAAPGSWSLYAAEKVGRAGRVLACDRRGAGVDLPEQVTFVQEDVFRRSPGFERMLEEGGPFDLVMSDMAPDTTGAKSVDQARSLELCLEAEAVAERWLKPGGHFVCKIFMGPDFPVFVAALRSCFTTVKTFKPVSSRAESKEIFEVGLGFKGRSGGAETPEE